jgi:hypothetical protein
MTIKGAGARLVLSGCDYLDTLSVPAATDNGTIIKKLTVSPSNFPSRLSHFANLYERFRFLKLTFHYTPNVAMTTPGQLVFAYDIDARDEYPTGADLLPHLLGNACNISFPVSKLTSYKLPLDASLPPCYTGYSVGAEMRTYLQGQFLIAWNGDLQATTMYLGSLYVDYEIEMLDPQYETPIETSPPVIITETPVAVPPNTDIYPLDYFSYLTPDFTVAGFGLKTIVTHYGTRVAIVVPYGATASFLFTLYTAMFPHMDASTLWTDWTSMYVLDSDNFNSALVWPVYGAANQLPHSGFSDVVNPGWYKANHATNVNVGESDNVTYTLPIVASNNTHKEIYLIPALHYSSIVPDPSKWHMSLLPYMMFLSAISPLKSIRTLFGTHITSASSDADCPDVFSRYGWRPPYQDIVHDTPELTYFPPELPEEKKPETATRAACVILPRMR